MKEFILYDYIVPMRVYRENAIKSIRDLMRPTKCSEAPARTIRGDFCNKENNSQNVIQGSYSRKNTFIEIKSFFNLNLNHKDEFNY